MFTSRYDKYSTLFWLYDSSILSYMCLLYKGSERTLVKISNPKVGVGGCGEIRTRLIQDTQNTVYTHTSRALRYDRLFTQSPYCSTAGQLCLHPPSPRHRPQPIQAYRPSFPPPQPLPRPWGAMDLLQQHSLAPLYPSLRCRWQREHTWLQEDEPSGLDGLRHFLFYDFNGIQLPPPDSHCLNGFYNCLYNIDVLTSFLFRNGSVKILRVLSYVVIPSKQLSYLSITFIILTFTFTAI